MSSSAPLFVRELCDPRVAIQWPEAVAFVMSLADEAGMREQGGVPDLEHVALTLDGMLEVMPGAPSSEPPARHLGRALQTLLAFTDGPDELHRIALDAVDAPDSAEFEDVVRAIGFFERPDRTEQLVALARRAADVREQFATEEELKRLEERERERARAAPPPRPAPAAKVRHPLPRWVFVAAPVGVVAIVVVVGALSWFRPDVGAAVRSPFRAIFGKPDIPPKPLPAEPAGESAARRPPSARPGPTAGQTAPLAGAESVTGEGGGVPAGPPADRIAEPGSAVGQQGAGSRGFRVVITDLGGEPLDDGSGRPIFTARDSRVSPAMLLRSPLPSQPPAGMSPADIGVFDMVIDEIGNVERVRLVSPTNRYQERMLVSAAKAWKFRPATRDGRPVRFRVQVRITW
jgi:hypothetical protein